MYDVAFIIDHYIELKQINIFLSKSFLYQKFSQIQNHSNFFLIYSNYKLIPSFILSFNKTQFKSHCNLPQFRIKTLILLLIGYCSSKIILITSKYCGFFVVISNEKKISDYYFSIFTESSIRSINLHGANILARLNYFKRYFLILK